MAKYISSRTYELFLRLLRHPLTMIVVLGAGLYFFQYTFLTTYLHYGPLVGDDSSGHAAIGRYYADNIFPDIWGWAPRWFGGLAFPQFYPPLFYFLVALIYKVTNLSYAVVFTGVIFTTILILPGLVAAVTLRISKSALAAWIAGIFYLLIECTFRSYDESLFGGTVQSTVNVGLITQQLGLCCFLVWLYFFVDKEKNWYRQFITVLLLAVSLVSNTFIPPLLLFCMIAFFIAEFPYQSHWRSRLTYVGSYIIQGIIPLLIVAMWYIPLLTHQQFASSVSQRRFDLTVLINAWRPLLIVFSLALYNIRKTKNKKIWAVLILFIFLFLPTVVPLEQWFPNSPIQSYRLLSGLLICISIVVGCSVTELRSRFNRSSEQFFVALYSLLILFCVSIFYVTGIEYQNYSHFYTQYERDQVKETSETLPPNSGRISTEAGLGSYNGERSYNYALLDPGLGNGNLESDYIVLTDSSLSSAFMLASRNSFSRNQEFLTGTSYIANDERFLKQPIAYRIDRAKYLGIKYIFTNNASSTRVLLQSPEVSRAEWGRWNMFAIKDAVHLAEVPSFTPTLLFAELKTKNRPYDSYDFLHFQEELFIGPHRNIIFTAPQDAYIDSSNDFARFPTVVISNYQYHDIQAAYQQLATYSEKNNLILMESSNPLFTILTKRLLNHSHKITIIPTESPANTVYYATRNSIKLAFKAIEEVQSVTAPQVSVQNIQAHGSTIEIQLSAKPTTPVPVLIRYSYFPTWKAVGIASSTAVYLATPTFMLVFATEQHVTLTFEKDSSVNVGYILSIIGFLLLIVRFLFSMKHVQRKK